MKITKAAAVNIGLLVLVNTLWAAQYAAYKLATEQMGPLTVSAWTFMMASIVLLPFLLWERRKSRIAPPPEAAVGSRPVMHRFNSLTLKNTLAFGIAVVLGVIPGSALLAWGIQRSTASNAAIIYLTLPVITTLLASIVLGERMTRLRWISLAVALAGVLLLSVPDLRQLSLTSTSYLVGNILVLLACFASSIYNVYCKELLGRFTPVEVLIYGYLLAFVCTLVLLHWAEPVSCHALSTYSSSTWLALATLSILSWGLAMILWMHLLKRLDVSQASVSIYLMPFLGVVISAVTLHEHIGISTVLGGMITLAGTILITTLEPSSVSE
jgi:drug/metabolite transporter (DMT)-like permease